MTTSTGARVSSDFAARDAGAVVVLTDIAETVVIPVADSTAAADRAETAAGLAESYASDAEDQAVLADAARADAQAAAAQAAAPTDEMVASLIPATSGSATSAALDNAVADQIDTDAIPATAKGVAGGVVTLDGTGQLVEVQVPDRLSPASLDAAIAAAMVGEPWRVIGAAGEPRFQNGWVAGNFETTRFRKRANGVVALRGSFTGSASSTTAFTLPSGYRPNELISFVVRQTGTTPEVGVCIVKPDGTVQLRNAGLAGDAEYRIGSVQFDVLDDS